MILTSPHSQVLDGEVYPPLVKDVQVDMHYPPHVPDQFRFAVGHEAFGLIPGLMMYATIWLREHNRVCEVLQQEHPDWDDERLFQTARLILIGENICRTSGVTMGLVWAKVTMGPVSQWVQFWF